MLTDSAARWLLVLHTVLGVAAVGAATHLVVWMRGYLRGKFGRHKAVRRFAWIALVLHALAFLVGNVVYPTYRVEVRAAYLENAGRITEEHAREEEAMSRLAEREGSAPPAHTNAKARVSHAAKMVRWFDVKEHWVALGLFASLALVLVLHLWDPRQGRRGLAGVVMALACVIAGTVWIGAIIGILVSATRAM